MTNAGDLPALKVIHTVELKWNGGYSNEDQLLLNCYSNSLQLAINHNLPSIAVPNISTGIYGFPKPRAANIVVQNLQSFGENSPIQEVYLVCYDQNRKVIDNHSDIIYYFIILRRNTPIVQFS